MKQVVLGFTLNVELESRLTAHKREYFFFWFCFCEVEGLGLGMVCLGLKKKIGEEKVRLVICHFKINNWLMGLMVKEEI